jgi:hypothetical protein
MNNKEILLTKLNETTQPYNKELMLSVVVASERVGVLIELKNIESIVNDITTEFPKLKIDDFKKAMRNGGLGHYGKTYKFCSQEICIWIREYLKQNTNTVERFYTNENGVKIDLNVL